MEKLTLKEAQLKYGHEGERFQRQLGEFIVEHNLKTIVETGSGISTIFILEALEKTGGYLHSIDPQPMCDFEIVHPQYTLIKKKSFEALADVYIKTGAWDLFLHDSDHWIECQTFEFEIARQCVRQGGYIFCDDYEWDGHMAWKKFWEWHQLIPFILGNIQGVTKTGAEVIDKNLVAHYADMEWESVKLTGQNWRQTNHRPPCHTCGSELSKDYWKYPEKTI